jgi:zinc protease
MRSRARSLLLGLLALPLGGLATHAQSAPATPDTATIPLDPAVRAGRLPNGLRYYIRRNARPEERVELRLVVNAGSVLEDDDQRGLAHFVEHMLFNGTRRFHKNDIVKYLESIGVRFGADLNASTGFDETIYILPVPTDKPELVERAFDILEDWASAALFDSAEVMAERGVVMEEWRGGLGAGSRIRDKQFPVIFRGSRYAERLPIGQPEILQRTTPAPLRRFYQDWYRPDLMAVVAVGDIDPDRVQRLVTEHFSGLKAPARPRPRESFPVPPNDAPLVTIATDPEEQVTTLSVLYKHPPQALRTAADYRRSLVQELYQFVLNQRLSELARKEETPFSVASNGYGSFVRSTDIYQLTAVTKDSQAVASLESMLVEAKRIREHGILASELERAKAALLRAYESAYAEREKTESANYADEYINLFLEGEPSPGIAWEYRTVQQQLPTIALAEVNAVGRAWITESNRIIALSAPENAATSVPTEQELLQAFRRAEAATVAAYTENVSADPLVAAPPTGATIASETRRESIGVTEWTLSNGVRVFLKPTDFKADEVLLRGWSPGGSSLVADTDLASVALATTAVERGGAGAFNAIELGKKLTGKQASATVFIDDVTEGVSGRASPKDLETMFELAYLKLTAPRRDSASFAAFLAQVRPFLANRASSPEAVFGDTVSLTMAQYHPRAHPINLEFLQQVSYDRAMELYRERFADFSDYTFVLVGAFTPEQVRPLVTRWLGGLPSTGRRENWRDNGVVPPNGLVEKTVRKGVEPKAQTVVLFHGETPFGPRERHALRSLTEYVEMRLLDNLREALGGTYSVQVGGTLERIPRERFTVTISYGSAPERADSLFATVLAVLDSVKAGAIDTADVAKVREQQLRQLEVSLKENSYWLVNLAARAENGEPLENMLTYAEFIRGLTAGQLRESAQKYLPANNRARFVLLPERPAQ